MSNYTNASARVPKGTFFPHIIIAVIIVINFPNVFRCLCCMYACVVCMLCVCVCVFVNYFVWQQKLEKLLRTIFHSNTIFSSTSNGFKMLLSDLFFFLFRLFSLLSHISLSCSRTHVLLLLFVVVVNATKTETWIDVLFE